MRTTRSRRRSSTHCSACARASSHSSSFPGTYETPQDLESIQDKLPTPERADVGTTSDLSAALRAIPDRQRRALLLREWRGFSYDEIGSELGLTQAATEALIFRARQNVAQRLGAALKALNGWPVLSFLRGLLQSASVKAVAVGAGAALTVVGVPAAEPELRSPSLTVPTAVHAAATRTPARSHRDVGALSPRSASDVGASRVEGNGSAAGARSHAAATPVGGTDTGAPASAPSGQATGPSVPAAAAPPPAASPKLPSVDAPAQGLVDTVTDAANSVELPPVTIPPVTVPPVSVGPVSTPAISTPPVTVHVQVPAVPPVHLP
jgi:hypothetical protein